MRGNGSTYVSFGYPTETDIRAVFDDRVARAAEVDIDIAAVVHAELATRDNYDTVLDSSNVCRAIDLATDQQTLLDSLCSQTGIRLSIGGGNGHVHDTVP